MEMEEFGGLCWDLKECCASGSGIRFAARRGNGH